MDLLIQIEAWTPLVDQGHNDVDSIYGKLVEVKLLYITPEKVENT